MSPDIAWPLIFIGPCVGFSLGAAVMGWITAPAKGIKVGDKVPQETLERWEREKRPLGAFIVVCPSCTRIDNIWAP